VLARYSGGGAGVGGRRRLRDRCPAKCRGCMCPPDVPRRAPAMRGTQEANRGRYSGGEPRQLARTRWDAEDSGCRERRETPTLSGMLSRTEVRTVDHKPSQRCPRLAESVSGIRIGIRQAVRSQRVIEKPDQLIRKGSYDPVGGIDTSAQSCMGRRCQELK